MKKPAAKCAAGLNRGGRTAFCKGCDAGVHLFDVAGGGACGAAGCLDGSAHLLLQETSAGRNLIMDFSTVNNPTQTFSLARPRAGLHDRLQSCDRTASPACTSRHPRARHASHASNDAACSGAILLAMHAHHMHPIAIAAVARMQRGTPKTHAALSRDPNDCASHKSDCAKNARTFLLCVPARDRLVAPRVPAKSKNPRR